MITTKGNQSQVATHYFVDSEDRTFYRDDIHTYIPGTVREIEESIYLALLEGQSLGKKIDFSVYPPALVEYEKFWPTATELAAKIDARVAEIYAAGARFETEYKAREAAAQAYKDAGYQGEVSTWITVYATPLGLSIQEATDQILRVAEDQRAAQETLGALRIRKYELANLVNEACSLKYQEILTAINVAGQVFES